MPYLNTDARTLGTTSNEKFQPLGRINTLFGVFMGFVKRTDDIQKMGRLQVWIPEFGSAPDEEAGWLTVSYCSPFAGATNVDTISKTDQQKFETTQTSYGMWMVPPDINNEVLVMFINGDSARGIWIGSMYNQYMNNMVPGVPASANNYQYPGKKIPVAEYNKWDTKVILPDRATKPYNSTKFKGIGNQGLINDSIRSVNDSSSRRESPSKVFGIVTPGPEINDNVAANKIRRKGGSSFIMDDAATNEYVQLSTKSGAQININETTGFVYLINRDGTSWVQMDKDGNVDIFGAKDITMRAQRDFNVRADRNINIEAGQNVFIKAAKDTKEETTSFTYDVNNKPSAATIPVWAYKGEGAGDGGSIVMQALKNWHSTAQKSAFLTVIDDNMNIRVGNAFSLTTLNGGQDYNSKKGIKLTADAAVDIAATGNIRVGSNGSISVVGQNDIMLCTNSNMSITAANEIIETAGGLYSLDADTVNIGTDIYTTATLSTKGTITTGDELHVLKSIYTGLDINVLGNVLVGEDINAIGDVIVGGGMSATGNMTSGGNLTSTGNMTSGGTISSPSMVSSSLSANSFNVDLIAAGAITSGAYEDGGGGATGTPGTPGIPEDPEDPEEPTKPDPAVIKDPIQTEAALSAVVAKVAEIKPMNDKLNILATWEDAESKFKRKAQSIRTTVSRFATYEPCPEHSAFSVTSIAGYSPTITPDNRTYLGSASAGNNQPASPAASVDPGANNTSVYGDTPAASVVSKDVNLPALRNQLVIHEGLRTSVYADTGGLPTAGIGHLLRTNERAALPIGSPISSSQVDTWYAQDSESAIKIAQEFSGDAWSTLSDVRKRAVVDLSYNLGKGGISKFVNFKRSLRSGNYAAAGQDLRDSAWYNQVGRRGPNITTMISQDVDPTGSDKKYPG
jgi:lysozyme